jgi:hypothetical protein
MYRIKGSDQKEYGPISADQIRQWVAENRLNRDSLAASETDPAWKPLGQFAEFADVFPAPPSALAGGPFVGDPRPRALKALNGPGITLIVLGSLGILVALASIPINLMNRQPIPLPQIPDPQMRQMLEMWMQFAKKFGVVSNVISIFWNAVILLGAVKMRKLEARGLAMTAAILATIPCFNPCCLLWMPIGIWALVALNNPDVKESYRRSGLK